MINLTTSAATKLEQIYKTAQELPDDASVRHNLTATQYCQLRSWGEDVLQAFTIRTLNLSELRAQSLLDQKAAAVYAVMQSVNQLMGLIHLTAEETDIVPGHVTDDTTVRLLKNLRWLTGRVCPPEHIMLLKDFHQKRPFLSSDTAFHLLLKMISSSSYS